MLKLLRKYALVLIATVVALSAVPCALHGQAVAGPTALAAAATSTCSAPSNAVLVMSIPATTGSAAFTITANASGNTISFFASGDNQATWVALNVNASNSTSPVTTTTGTGTFRAAVAGYSQVCIEISAFVGGTATVSIRTGLPSAGAGSGLGGGSVLPAGPTTPNGVTFTACSPVGSPLTYCWPGITVTLQTGATYPLAAADRSTCIEINNAAMTVTMPDLGGTNFAFGYNGCLQNLGSAATINRNTTSTFTVIGDQSVAAGATTWTLFANQTAYFYTDTNNNYIVVVVGMVGTGNVVALNGTATVTATPPNVLTGGNGWKFCWSGTGNCFGGGSQSANLMVQQGGNGWLSIFSSLPSNNAGSGSPDTSAGVSFYNAVGAMMGKEHAGCGFTNLSGEALFCMNQATHELSYASNGSSSRGQIIRSEPTPTNQKTESAADTNVLTFTPIAAAGSYRIRFVMSVSAASAATLGWTATWTDSNGNAQTPTNLSLFQTGVAAPALTFTTSAAGNYYGDAQIDVNNAAANIVIKLTFSGTSFTAKVSASVEPLILTGQ